MLKRLFELFENNRSKKYLILDIFKSKYCLLVLIVGLIGGYYLIPKKIFDGTWYLIGILYIIIFAVVSACIVKVVKEKAMTMKNTGASIVAIIFAALGIGAMQVCGVGAPICGATVGVGLFSLFFPNLSIPFLDDHALFLIILSIAIQIAALYFLNCFKKYSSKSTTAKILEKN
ncbi:MAG: hypothetical protein GWO87_03535 [Xanthomonadaceae bacterium]|nr:hypothetical protein [Rhodospirillaceae bacterium]NIA18233.1 hypothetical protein [Xanthomonadaceae bacterium]